MPLIIWVNLHFNFVTSILCLSLKKDISKIKTFLIDSKRWLKVLIKESVFIYLFIVI